MTQFTLHSQPVFPFIDSIKMELMAIFLSYRNVATNSNDPF